MARHDPEDQDRPKLSRRDVRSLVWSTYKTSLPYLLVFLVLFLGAVWFVTEVLF